MLICADVDVNVRMRRALAASLISLKAGTTGSGPEAVGGKYGPVFNKMRMTVFPKWYQFNHANPTQTGTAYEIIKGSEAANATSWNCVGGGCPSLDGSFDLTRFNVSFWRNYERLVGAMRSMGVVADIIVFHPYDSGHWVRPYRGVDRGVDR